MADESGGIQFDPNTFDLSLGEAGDEDAGFLVVGPGGVDFAFPGGNVTGGVDGGGAELAAGPVDLSGDLDSQKAATSFDLAGDRELSLSANRDAGGLSGEAAFEDGDLTRSIFVDDGVVKNKTSTEGVSFVDTLTEQLLSFTHGFTDGSSVGGTATHEGDGGGFTLGGSVPIDGGSLTASAGASTDGSVQGNLGIDGGAAGMNLGFDAGGSGTSMKLSGNAALDDDQAARISLGMTESGRKQTVSTDVSAEVIDDLTLSGKLSSTGGELSGSAGAALRRDDVAADLDVTKSGVSGEALVQLHDRIFAGGMGAVDFDGSDAFVGGEVGVMPAGGLGITGAAGVGTNGATARLQADLVGGGVDGAGDFLDKRDAATFGGFLEIGSSALNQFLGAPEEKADIPGTDVTAGLRFSLPF